MGFHEDADTQVSGELAGHAEPLPHLRVDARSVFHKVWDVIGGAGLGRGARKDPHEGCAQIHGQAPEADIRATALAKGMRLMRDDGERLVAAGITSREEVLRVTRD